MSDIAYPDKHPGGWIANKGWDKLPLVIPRRIRPSSGCELVSSRQFPSKSQGNYLLNNVIGFPGVLQHTLADKDAGCVGEEIEPLIYCEDSNFRPVDLQFGPDGALYIVDLHNALIGHLQHNLRDPSRDESHGRIWQSHNFPDGELLEELLDADRHEVRAAAVRVLSFWSGRVDNAIELLRARISDKHPRVRLEAVRACSFLKNSKAATEVALDVLNHGVDEWIEYTLEETLRGLEK